MKLVAGEKEKNIKRYFLNPMDMAKNLRFKEEKKHIKNNNNLKLYKQHTKCFFLQKRLTKNRMICNHCMHFGAYEKNSIGKQNYEEKEYT